MTIITLPTIHASGLKWSLATNTMTFSSPLSQSTQRRELPGARWTASVTFTDRNASEHRVWMARLARLRGAAGSCYLSPSFAYPLMGAGGGTPLVNGAGQTGTSLIIDGAPNNITGWLKEGDYFSFDNGLLQRELKIVTADVNTDSSGNATITFEPPIRSAPANNAAIEINTPSAIMRLVDDQQAAWTLRAPSFGSTTIQFIETFPS